jgi:hypothetical protein
MTTKLPISRKIYQMAVNGLKIYLHFPYQGPPKHTQVVIWVIKINHLATLLWTVPTFLAAVGILKAEVERLEMAKTGRPHSFHYFFSHYKDVSQPNSKHCVQRDVDRR